MKTIILLLLFSVFSSHGTNAQVPDRSLEGITFYLVRHAEKDTGNDPVLSMLGYERAGDLYRFLKNKSIDGIYFSQFRRTKLTGDSLLIYQQVDTVRYLADLTGETVLEKVIANSGKHKNVLVIGHSNTIPAIIKRLGADLAMDLIPDNEYDNLYIVGYKNHKTTVVKVKYGKSSATENSSPAMKPLQ
ncbi:MAG: phosphoglycerate mutase family protein [Ferruginibacter sp.]